MASASRALRLVRVACVASVAGLSACASPRAAAPRADRPAPGSQATEATRSRWRMTSTDAFWVSRSTAGARVILGGARLEIDPAARVTGAAWAPHELSARVLVGSLEVGGDVGFVHWSLDGVFTSRTFLGPLVPVGGPGPRLGVRGVRKGPAGVPIAVTDVGLFELRGGALVLAPDAGVIDAIGVGDEAAARVDVFGRASFSGDRGRTWRPLTDDAALGAHGFAVVDGSPVLETSRGRSEIGRDGSLTRLAPRRSSNRRAPSPYGAAWSTPSPIDLARGAEELPFSPLAVAIKGAATFGDGTALAAADSSMMRVALATATPAWTLTGQNDAMCQVVPIADGALVACFRRSWDRRGAFVLRSAHGEPPVLERTFKDPSATFVTDGAGALAFTSTCAPAEPVRDDDGRVEERQVAAACVRRPDGSWREVSLPPPFHVAAWSRQQFEPSQVVAWVPTAGGDVTAIVQGAQTPERRDVRAPGAGEATEIGGARVLRVDMRGLAIPFVTRLGRNRRGSAWDTRFAARADGGVDAWFEREGRETAYVGGAISASGVVALSALPPGIVRVVVGGGFGLAIDGAGRLHETRDHGRTWRDAGLSPLPPAAFSSSGACSRLGCETSGLTRVGWGPDDAAVHVEEAAATRVTAAKAFASLTCAPKGLPAPHVVEKARTGIVTPDGGRIEFKASPNEAPAKPPPDGAAKASPKLAGARTDSLSYRLPFAGVDRRDAVAAPGLRPGHRHVVGPLLDERGDAGWVLNGETSDVILSAGAPMLVASHPRWSEALLGAVRLADRLVVLVRDRQRLGIDVEPFAAHAGVATRRFGSDRDLFAGTHFALGRADDGGLAVVLLEAGGGVTIVRLTSNLELGAPERYAPLTSMRGADQPSCRATKGSFRAAVAFDADDWFSFSDLPGLQPTPHGVSLVVFGRDHVCLEATDFQVDDARAHGSRSRFVARFKGQPSASLDAPDARVELTCKVTGRAP